MNKIAFFGFFLAWFNNCNMINKGFMMNPESFNKKVGIFYLVAVVFTVCVVLASCARKIHFNTSNVVPAAQGTVKVKKDDNNNYSIQMNVKNLATPGRLQPPKSVYVVWVESAGRSAQNLGQMKTSSGMFSN